MGNSGFEKYKRLPSGGFALSGPAEMAEALRLQNWRIRREEERRQGEMATGERIQTRRLATTSTPSPSPPAPVWKLRKDSKAHSKAAKSAKPSKAALQFVPGWDLAVGIEIHAQLNTPHKLFSPASPSAHAPPNTRVAPFDAALPGSQPVFQPGVLIPAVRAALALRCAVQPASRFDRKHYFHWDQPAGYQITQYYAPLARDGSVTLRARDGLLGDEVEVVGIQQVQMEQDTAKTLAQPGGVQWVDLNRAGAALVEIISRPTMRSPAAAAAFVRKVQGLLRGADACVVGMEEGGLRADVNVSVKRAGEAGPLGTRVEVKNLSSFKAVEDAVVAERDRQIAVLEGGGLVEAETRGWTVGGTETRRLRGKEGEVDYRYMPDPDLGPVVVDPRLVEHLAERSGMSVDEELDELVGRYGLTEKDAVTLTGLDDGNRVQYFYNVLEALETLRTGNWGEHHAPHQPEPPQDPETLSRLAANWCLHKLGKLTNDSSLLAMTPNGECVVPSGDLATIIHHLHEHDITAKTANALLLGLFSGDIPPGHVRQTIDEQQLWFHEISRDEYAAVADAVVADGDVKAVLDEFLKYYQQEGGKKQYPEGKLMFLVGRMMRVGEKAESMDPGSAEGVMRKRIKEVYVPRMMRGAGGGGEGEGKAEGV
ncbi:GatB/GatE catalytic domain-containing protein [Schizothecium vesticola]|uniref:Glutamyl-tRNA(Gln) amidotransferase subunit B, mitochondrial n=1 Tax=Schizothecium vesticola TaxID=314040 RepID=A0AA40F315_9PEZI|nr:GatB/GatE catalytic domain-containing protein [Schizothecium vesticola]